MAVLALEIITSWSVWEKKKTLEVFRARLDGTLNNLVEKCPMAQRLELDGLLGPFQTRPFHDSIIYVTVGHGDLRLGRCNLGESLEDDCSWYLLC